MTTERVAETMDRLDAIVGPLAEREGFELIDLELKRGPKQLMLRVTIDRPSEGPYRGRTADPKPTVGVTVADCAAISRLLGPILDVEDVLVDAYTLEVSSPGINRALKHQAHFEKALGLRVRVKTRAPIDAEKFFIATLAEVNDEAIVLDLRGKKTVTVPYRLIASANIEFQF